jgi:DNA-binding GntR family transcriptional regulator
MTTLSQTISERLTGAIISGELSPGTKLDEKALAEQFDVSRTPIREALRQLAATRLVRFVPRRGFSVAEFDPHALDDMFEGASELEALCARLCALRAGPMDRRRIEVLHQQAVQAIAKGDVKGYAALNEEFHNAIYAGTRNATLQTMVADLRQRLAPFRSRVFFTAANRMKSSLAEHDPIVRALLAHDGDEAANAMRSHATNSAMNALQYLRSMAPGAEPVSQRRRGPRLGKGSRRR